ncbi:MAG: ribosome biogenesis GTPase Der [Candidatus Latescibacteria bacterium]|nr:ribosome biogenesis GTPase Der [Candidatus Latescibacterota bacterium]MBT4141444.1 ribosome biogenesis GTPase Der [Candidatus Latescibacterota bacterium]MBT5831934.1 ribosome biogenesis GTPase Der [Candidatus Latescibacterota bacterium]
MDKGVVAILGRPNVGKSTLFNRLIGERKAVIEDFPGVTRDRNYGEVIWGRDTFTLIDTGGYLPDSGENLQDSVSDQVEIALGEADALMMIVDARTGPVDHDELMARMIRDSGKPYLLVVNKVDGDRDDADATLFYKLGLGEPTSVSAINGRLSGDLLDKTVAMLPEGKEAEEEQSVPRIAIIGRPNMGKSTLVNQILGEQRVVVSSIPGTTRDAIDMSMERDGREFIMIDTAGLRRRARSKEQVEYYSSLRTASSLERCDVAILMVDATEGCTVQDVKIVERAIELGKGVVISINKWDLIEKDHQTAARTETEITDRFKSLSHFPIVFGSALTGQRAWRLIDEALAAFDRRAQHVSTGDLNKFLVEINETTAPPTKNGRIFRMSFCVMPRSSPPTILFFTSRPKDVPVHYKRFLENRLREEFDFFGTPIRVVFRKK